jgi:murein L,D-transpeptidase YcbB/YkuD
VRAYSHGCIRLADPFDFAYALLSRQTSNPEDVFQAHLRSGVERRVDLAEPVPVHLVYRTAYTQPEGRMQYRRDIYGRDGRIWNALAREGVALRAIRG